MHRIIASDELSKLFLSSIPVTLSHLHHFVLALRDGDRALVWKNVGGTLSVDPYPDETAWPEGIPAVNGLTVLVEEKGCGDHVIQSHRLIMRFQVADSPEELWLVGDDRAKEATQVFLAYENPQMERIETVVIVEGEEKKPRSCGSLSFNREAKKALNIYVRIVTALMGLSAVSLAPMLDGGSPPQLPSGPDGTAGEREAGHV